MAEYIQGRADGIIFRKEGNEYARYNPWKAKWVAVSSEDGSEQFHDYSNNRTSCTGKNLAEVIKAQAEYCVKHKEDFSFSEFSDFVLE